MWAVQLVGSLNKVYHQFKTHWGYALHVLNYRQMEGKWKSVSWSGTTVVKTALITPKSGESIEITDLIIATDKVQNAVITLEFGDGTNTEYLIIGNTTDAPLIINHAVAGRFHAWEDAILYYTVAVGSSTGTILIGYIRHGTGLLTLPYEAWNSYR